MAENVASTQGLIAADTTARERQRKIEMSDSTWIVLIGHLVKRRARPTFADAVGWLATLVLTVPVIFTRGGDLKLGDFGPEYWFVASILLAGFSLLMATRAVLFSIISAAIDFEFERGGKKRHFHRNLSWVPCEIPEFVQFVRRQLQEEQNAAQESVNTLAIGELRKQMTELADRVPTQAAP